MERAPSLRPERLDEKTMRRMEQLRARFPGVIREDSEHFIYDLTDKNGKHMEMHTPKWKHIPVVVSEGDVRAIPVDTVIETELTTRHLFGDNYSIARALGLRS
ncbi:MAG: hypothetical protein IT406_01800 [Candidatus Yanofskybacteria bacterium]|nr:hypothetical protein [Candidatus Yanofskybacteria bacterium]